jgi:hypothetical protein
MRSSVRTRTPLIAGLMAGLLVAIVSVPLNAQPAEEVHPKIMLGYDKAHEISISGNIQEVVGKPAPGSPAGLHVLVNSANGVVDAHLGPYMTKETKEALHEGTPVQILGAMQKGRTKDYLLARELMVGGRTIRVRSEKGFLVRQGKAGAERHFEVRESHTTTNGGAQ